MPVRWATGPSGSLSSCAPGRAASTCPELEGLALGKRLVLLLAPMVNTKRTPASVDTIDALLLEQALGVQSDANAFHDVGSRFPTGIATWRLCERYHGITGVPDESPFVADSKPSIHACCGCSCDVCADGHARGTPDKPHTEACESRLLGEL
jgi:hypothetical protein